MSLIDDPNKLKEERKKYAGWKSRIEGVGGGIPAVIIHLFHIVV